MEYENVDEVFYINEEVRDNKNIMEDSDDTESESSEDEKKTLSSRPPRKTRLHSYEYVKKFIEDLGFVLLSKKYRGNFIK